jgi:hypothetical protein
MRQKAKKSLLDLQQRKENLLVNFSKMLNISIHLEIYTLKRKSLHFGQ